MGCGVQLMAADKWKNFEAEIGAGLEKVIKAFKQLFT